MAKIPMEKLLKLYALAMRGVDGERENARRILDRMLKESGCTMEEIERAANEEYNAREIYTFTAKADLPQFIEVVAQLIFSFGLRDGQKIAYCEQLARRGAKYRFELTRAEYILLSLFWEPCYQAYAKTVRKLKARQTAERARLKKKHTAEKDSLAEVFIAVNSLYSKKSAEEPCETEAEEAKLEYDLRDFETFDHDHESKLDGCQAKLCNNE